MKIGRNRRQVDFPEQWRKVLGERLRWWPLGDAELQRNLEQTVIGFLSSKSFESARGLDLTEDIKVTIAAQASLLVLGIGLDEYRDVTTIIVYPSTAVRSSSVDSKVVSSLKDQQHCRANQCSTARSWSLGIRLSKLPGTPNEATMSCFTSSHTSLTWPTA